MTTQQDQPSARRPWLPVLRVGPWLAGILATIGLLADIDSLMGIPRKVLVAFALLIGLAITALGCVLYGREWNKPLRWPATRGAAIAAAGISLTVLSLVGLLPDMFSGVGGLISSDRVPITLRRDGEMDLDPKDAASEPDISVRRASYILASGQLYFGTPSRGSSVFVRVAKASGDACSAAKGWTDAIEPVQDHLICVKTDMNRFVTVEILSVEEDLITFRTVYESTLPTSSTG